MRAETKSVKESSEPLDLRDLIETIPALVACTLPDGSIEFVNRAWQEYTGGSSPELSRCGWQSIIHADDIARFNQWRPDVTTGKPFEAEARIRRADGEYRWFLIRKTLAVAQTQSGQSSLRTLIACEDIDDRKQAQVRLQQSETQLQAFFENSPSLIFLKDREGRYLYANKQFKRTLRIAEDEIKGKRDDELFSAEQAAAFQASDRQVLEAGAPIEFERVVLQEDGEYTNIVQKFPLFNAEGIIYAIGGIVTDITERKRAEAARRYSEERHRLIVEAASDAVLSMDEHGAIVFANPATLRIFGHDPAELIGKPLTVLMPEIMRKAHEAGFKRYAATGQKHINWQGTELTALHKNGQEFPVEVSFGELMRDGHRIFTGFVRDISERKQVQEAQHALQSLQLELARVSRLTTMGQLAASIAHEVNQPLTAVTNNGSACLRLLANHSLEPDVLRRALEEIVADGVRASAVIARIRAFIKKRPAEKNELDINEVIQEVLALARRELYDNQVLVECQLADALPLVLADRIQLQQVLLNLIMNGNEAMTAVTDRPRLLSVQSRIDESGDILVAVHDSGPGLGPEADRVFTPFFTTKANGMGMGLTISRSLIEGHGGRLWAKSDLPHGAVFSFTLPVAAGGLL